MADKKVTDLPALTVADDADLFPVVDVSGNVTKKVTRAGLVPDGSISTTKIADDAVTNAKLQVASTIADGWDVVDLGAVKILTIRTDARSTSTSSGSQNVSLPTGVLSSILSVTATATSMTGEARVVVSVTSSSTSAINLNYTTTSGSGTARAYVTVMGTS